MMNGYEYTGMDAILAGSFRAAIYCRLSKDDDLDGESASIANQRDMLESYCEKQGWEVVAKPCKIKLCKYAIALYTAYTPIFNFTFIFSEAVLPNVECRGNGCRNDTFDRSHSVCQKYLCVTFA